MKFDHGASFPNAVFGHGAFFKDAAFGHRATFDSAAFGNGANFNGAAFGNEASFNSATFGNWATFAKIKFDSWCFYWLVARKRFFSNAPVDRWLYGFSGDMKAEPHALNSGPTSLGRPLAFGPPSPARTSTVRQTSERTTFDDI